MYVSRILSAALILVLVGCQFSRESRVQDPEPEGGSPIGGRGISTPARLTSEPQRDIQPAAFVEPVEAPPQPEPLPTPAEQPSADLTIEQLEQMALSNNPSLRQAAASVEATRGLWLQVGLPPNPDVGYLGQQLGSGGQAEQHGLLIQQEFVRGGKLRLNRAIVAQEIRKAEQIWAAQQQRVLTDVRLGYYDVLIAQRRRDVAQRLVDIAEEAAKVANALLKAEEVGQVDVMRAQVELQTVQLSLKNARNAYTAAWSRLAAVLGLPDIEPRPLVGELEGGVVDIDPKEALDRILGRSPEIAAALADVERARWAIDRAYVEPIPNLTVQGVVMRDNGVRGTDGIIQATVPIPIFNRNQGGTRRAQAELVAAERTVDRVELNLQRRLATVFQRYANARNQVEDYSKTDGILENAKATLEFLRQGYQAGEFAYLDLLTAQRTYSQTNLAYTEALGELWASVVEINGLLLKDSLDSQSAGISGESR